MGCTSSSLQLVDPDISQPDAGAIHDKLRASPGLFSAVPSSSVLSPNCDTGTPLHVACERGQVQVVHAMLSFLSTSPLPTVQAALQPYCRRAGRPPPASTDQAVRLAASMTNSKGQTPLMLSCAAGKVELVKLLLAWGGADPWVTDSYGSRIALHYAAMAGSVPCIRALLKHTSQHMSPSPSQQHLQLQPEKSQHQGHERSVKHARHTHNGSTNKAEKSQHRDRSPSSCCGSHNFPRQRYYQDGGVDEDRRYVNTRTVCGLTALHYAVFFNKPAAVEELLLHGPNIQATTNSHNYDVFVPGDALCTPLHFAALRGNPEVARMLLMHHVEQCRRCVEQGTQARDPRCRRNDNGATPWEVATLHHPGHRDLAVLLHPSEPLEEALGLVDPLIVAAAAAVAGDASGLLLLRQGSGSRVVGCTSTAAAAAAVGAGAGEVGQETAAAAAATGTPRAIAVSAAGAGGDSSGLLLGAKEPPPLAVLAAEALQRKLLAELDLLAESRRQRRQRLEQRSDPQLQHLLQQRSQSQTLRTLQTQSARRKSQDYSQPLAPYRRVAALQLSHRRSQEGAIAKGAAAAAAIATQDADPSREWKGSQKGPQLTVAGRAAAAITPTTTTTAAAAAAAAAAGAAAGDMAPSTPSGSGTQLVRRFDYASLAVAAAPPRAASPQPSPQPSEVANRERSKVCVSLAASGSCARSGVQSWVEPEDNNDDSGTAGASGSRQTDGGCGAGAGAGTDEVQEEGVCGMCLSHPEEVAPAGCGHGLCGQCAAELCRAALGSVAAAAVAGSGRVQPLACPLCREEISGFVAATAAAAFPRGMSRVGSAGGLLQMAAMGAAALQRGVSRGMTRVGSAGGLAQTATGAAGSVPSSFTASGAVPPTSGVSGYIQGAFEIPQTLGAMGGLPAACATAGAAVSETPALMMSARAGKYVV